MYKIELELTNGIRLCADLPAKLVSTLRVEEPPAMGDVNGDGAVNEADARLIMDHLAGSVTLDETAQTRADVNGDGNVTYLDAMAIMERQS